MNQGTPSDNKISKELEPSEFETPTPLSPFETAKIDDIASGVQLPAVNKAKV